MRQGKVLIFCILLFFAGDLLRFFSGVFEFDFRLYTRFSKIIGLFIIMFHILFEKKYKSRVNQNIFIAISILTSSFIIGNYFLEDVSFFENIEQNFSFYTKAIFLPILFIYFNDLDKDSVERPLKVLEVIFWLNCIIILIAFIFKLPQFSTYQGGRFGYMGVFDRSTYTSYLFVFFVCYFFYGYLKNRSYNYLVKLLLSLAVSFLVGTKRLYFFDIVFLIYACYKLEFYKRRLVWVGISILALITLFFEKDINLFLIQQFKVIYNVYIKYGLISSITSLRSDLLVDYYYVVINEQWGYTNYLFGGPFFHEIRPEIDLIDSYLFFGVFGPIFFLMFFNKFLFSFNIQQKSSVNNFLMIVLFFFYTSSSGIIFSGTFGIPAIVFGSYFKSIEDE